MVASLKAGGHLEDGSLLAVGDESLPAGEEGQVSLSEGVVAEDLLEGGLT